jgi:hypothetical protein
VRKFFARSVLRQSSNWETPRDEFTWFSVYLTTFLKSTDYLTHNESLIMDDEFKWTWNEQVVADFKKIPRSLKAGQRTSDPYHLGSVEYEIRNMLLRPRR